MVSVLGMVCTWVRHSKLWHSARASRNALSLAEIGGIVKAWGGEVMGSALSAAAVCLGSEGELGTMLDAGTVAVSRIAVLSVVAVVLFLGPSSASVFKMPSPDFSI